MSAAAVFAAVFAAYLAGHQVADFWAQTSRQALRKGLPGWAGRRACAGHVTTYTLLLAGFLALTAWQLALPVSPGRAAAGLALSAVTHYWADRRRPLEQFARLVGKGEFWDAGGAAAMDQAFHWAFVFAAALITAGSVS